VLQGCAPKEEVDEIPTESGGQMSGNRTRYSAAGCDLANSTETDFDPVEVGPCVSSDVAESSYQFRCVHSNGAANITFARYSARSCTGEPADYYSFEANKCVPEDDSL
ncbi:unnamed protein product, partial [Symbiodinium natans]